MNQDITVTENVSEIREENKKRKRTKGFIIGIIINILALIGVIAIILSSIYAINNMFTQDREKEKWADFVFPVVMVNPPDFESIDDAPFDDIRLIAVWSALIHTDIDSLERDAQTNYLMIPESEVAKQAAILFGNDYPFVHTSVNAPDISYSYDSEEKAYLIRDYDVIVNTPYILEIEKTEEGLQLAVGYLPPATPWELNPDGSRKINTAEKYVYYIINVDDPKTPKIVAIRPAEDLNKKYIELPEMAEGDGFIPPDEASDDLNLDLEQDVDEPINGTD